MFQSRYLADDAAKALSLNIPDAVYTVRDVCHDGDYTTTLYDFLSEIDVESNAYSDNDILTVFKNGVCEERYITLGDAD